MQYMHQQKPVRKIGLSLRTYLSTVVKTKTPARNYVLIYSDTTYQSAEECIAALITGPRSIHFSARQQGRASVIIRTLWKRPGRLIQPRLMNPPQRIADEMLQIKDKWVPAKDTEGQKTQIKLVPVEHEQALAA